MHLLLVYTSEVGPGHLFVEGADKALIIQKGAQTLLPIPNTFVIIVPRVRGRTYTFPVAATGHLVMLGLALSMIELSTQLYHTQCQRTFASIRVHIYEYIVIRTILLNIFILYGAWNVCVPFVSAEGLANLRSKFAI